MTEITNDSGKLHPAVQEFVLRWGDLGGQWGVNRSVAQIQARVALEIAAPESVVEVAGLPGGGGQAAYFDFLRLELIPYVEGTFGGHPGRRALFGHSHGGSFVLFAMFSEPADRHSFAACLSCDASIGCMVPSAYGWEASYAALYPTLPVRLHLSYASAGNAAANMAYADTIAQRDYRDLTFVAQVYPGTHGGIVPQALADAVAFAFAGG